MEREKLPIPTHLTWWGWDPRTTEMMHHPCSTGNREPREENFTLKEMLLAFLHRPEHLWPLDRRLEVV